MLCSTKLGRVPSVSQSNSSNYYAFSCGSLKSEGVLLSSEKPGGGGVCSGISSVGD